MRKAASRFLLTRAMFAAASFLVAASAGAAIGAAPDACALISTAQVSSALGVTVNPGKATLPGACQWDQPGKPGESLWTLRVNFADKDRWKLAATTPQPGVTITPVAGLGDDAFYYSRGTQLTSLSLKKGDTAVVVRLSGGKGSIPEIEAKEKLVAQQIVNKL